MSATSLRKAQELTIREQSKKIVDFIQNIILAMKDTRITPPQQEANKPNKQRINYLDVLKCLGILLVIEGHVTHFGMGIDTYDTVSGLMLYTFNMPIFFFVSGFLAYKSNNLLSETEKTIWQKFLYLVIPALVFFFYIKLKGHENPLDLFTKGIGGYWFTVTLWECFSLYYIIAVLPLRERVKDIPLIGVGLLGVVFLSLKGDWGPKLLDLNRLTKYFQFFAMGLLAKKYNGAYEWTMRNEVIKTIALLGFFALLFTVNYPIWPKPVFHLMRDVVLRYLGTYIVISYFFNHAEFFNHDTKLNRLILDIGKKSLAIYLLQYLFLPDFTAYVVWLEGMDGFTVHMIAFGYSVLVVMACYVFISLLSNSKFVKKYVLGQK